MSIGSYEGKDHVLPQGYVNSCGDQERRNGTDASEKTSVAFRCGNRDARIYSDSCG